MHKVIKPTIIFVILMVALFLGSYLKPTLKIISEDQIPDLEKIIPKSFLDWKMVENSLMIIPDLEAGGIADAIYNRTLERTYYNSKGQEVMLSIAYGIDQSDALGAHKPEVCYPAQGFQVKSIEDGIVSTKFKDLNIKYVVTEIKNIRKEYVIYWILVGDKVPRGDFDRKLQQLSYGFQGIVPDGLLFRVSSIGEDKEKQFDIQKNFIKDLINNLDKPSQQIIIGR